MLAVTTSLVAERIEVTGIVQGVGFRPFVYRLAKELGLVGHVGNDSTMVFIVVQGTPSAIDSFAQRLARDAPPLSSVEHVSRQVKPVDDADGFSIVASRSAVGGRTLVPPDTAVCDDCVREMLDPTDRRYRHPFITCTNCGPRFTIMSSLPYDRINTTMAGFEMCPTCRGEYTDPNDRRYHAQPISCHDCGPQLSFSSASGVAVEETIDLVSGPEAIVRARLMLRQGLIVAIKGIGGFHLACDANTDAAVQSLRSRKHRPDKPLAIMVADLVQARALAHIDDAEADLLLSPARPIVLLRARSRLSLSELVAPNTPLIGIMLPYTPVHHLLFQGALTPLVLTSANLSGEAIAHQDEDQRPRQLSDGVLSHDRPIQIPCDDSVVRVANGRLLPIRRARGYAPVPVSFPVSDQPNLPTPSVLAVGGDLKSTFCVASDGHAWVSQHLGDRENYQTQQAFESALAHFRKLFAIQPQTIAADIHPDYKSSRWADHLQPGRVLKIQHHHAHVASVMAEHQRDPFQPVIGFAFDGTGYGDDGSIWGGEVMVADVSCYQRVAHLAPVLLPGGDAGVRNPYRMALSHLFAAGIKWDPTLAPVCQLDEVESRLLEQQFRSGFGCQPTTSMGRLFDAVASLLGLRHEISFEAQAAIDLEVAAEGGTLLPGYQFGLGQAEATALVIEPGPLLQRIIADLKQEVPMSDIAFSFHQAIADMIVQIALGERLRRGLETTVLTGGVFQNALLVTLCADSLAKEGFEVLTHSLVPPNDGGLSLGQSFIAVHWTKGTG